MKKLRNPCHIFHMMKLAVIIIVSILLNISVFISIDMPMIASAEGIEWSVTVDITETNGNTDYAIFGEATDANDGPPVDNYDEPKPPVPIDPYIRTWFNDSLSSPYDFMFEDYRSYPDTYKVWNLSVKWVPSDYETPTDVTISWDNNEVNNSEYASVIIYDIENDIEVDMKSNSYYDFYCPAMITKNFNIICQGYNNPPEIPNKPTGETNGYHGTPYSYNTSTTDPEEDNVFYWFDWSDGTNSGWIGPYSSGEIINASHTWESPGIYNVTVKAMDIHYSESNWSSQLLITMGNRPPYSPSNPSPKNQSTNIDTGAVLSWTGSDPDGDIVIYDIYFGTETPPPKIVTKQSSTSFDPSLSTQTKYYWNITSWDNFGESTPGPIWEFTTKTTSNGGNGGNGPPNGGPSNTPPTADASASETVGLINSPIIFDGTRSFDQNGYIKNWSWNFGDGKQGTGEIISHTYANKGIYNVTLTVTDNQDATDTDLITVYIGIANIPPSKPTVSGETYGNKNVKYPFTAMSTDPNNDNISYNFDWGDGTTNTTSYLPNGRPVTVWHSWTSSGIYNINVTASDNQTISGNTKLLILIDAQYFGDMGYMLDTNSDGIFDLFRNESTLVETAIELRDENYLIDIDGDGDWDYKYNIKTGAITQFTEEPINEIPWTVIVLIVVALIIISLIVYFFKKGYF